MGLDGRPAKYATKAYDAEKPQNRSLDGGAPFFPFEVFNAWANSQDIKSPEGYERMLVLETQLYEPSHPDEVVPGSLFMSDEESRAVAQFETELKNYSNQYMVSFITGQRDIDAEWDDYVAGFKRLKLDEYLAIIQKAYNETN